MKKIFYVILLIIFLVPLNVFAKDVGNQGFYLFYDYTEKPVDSSAFTIQCCGNASAEFTAGFVLKDGYDYANEPLYIDLYFDLWVANRPNFMEEISTYLTASLYNNGNYGNLAKSVNISRYADGGYGIRVRLKIEPPSSSNTAIMVGFILTNGWWHSTTLRYVSYDIFYQSDKSLRDNADKSAQIYNQNQQIIDQNAATNDKLDETNDKLDETNDKLNETNENLNKIDESITNSDVDSSTADSFFSNFENIDHGGISGIVTAPLRFINNLTGTCEPISFELLGKNIELPCGDTLFWNKPEVENFRVVWNILFGGSILFALLTKLFKVIQGLKNPDDSRIEVMKL